MRDDGRVVGEAHAVPAVARQERRPDGEEGALPGLGARRAVDHAMEDGGGHECAWSGQLALGMAGRVGATHRRKMLCGRPCCESLRTMSTLGLGEDAGCAMEAEYVVIYLNILCDCAHRSQNAGLRSRDL